MTAPFLHRQTVRVTYGEPVDLSAYSGRRLSQETLVEVTNLLMSKLAELGGVEFTPAGLPGEAASDTSLQRSRA